MPSALDHDVARVGAITMAVGPSIALRLDANGAWPAPVARQAARLFAAFTPQWLEQPVPLLAIDDLAMVRQLAAVPIAADEAVR